MSRLRRRLFSATGGSLLLLLLISALVGVSLAQDKDGVVEKDFHMRPGVEEQQVQLVAEDAGVGCTFSYRCSGGTGESWKLSIVPSSEEPNRYACVVGRPNPPSYLLVNHFFLALEPAGAAAALKLDSAEAMGGGKLVPSSQYIVDTELAQVRPSESWGGSLEQLAAVVEVEMKKEEKDKKKKRKRKTTTKKAHKEEL